MAEKQKEDTQIRNSFFVWLAKEVPAARLSDLYIATTELEEYCVSKRLLSSSIFAVLDKATVTRLRVRLEGDKLFKFFNRGKTERILSVLKYYADYLSSKELLKIQNSTVQIIPATVPVFQEDIITPVKPAVINKPVVNIQSSIQTEQTNINPSLEGFRSFLREQGRKVSDIQLLIDALTEIDMLISKSADYDGSITAANSDAEASRIFLSLLADDTFHQLNRKLDGRCVSAAQLYIRMLKENQANIVSEPKAEQSVAQTPDNQETAEKIPVTQPVQVSSTKEPLIEAKPVTNQLVMEGIPADPILSYAKQKGITWIDKRQQNGCLWLIGDMKLYQQINELRKMGYDFKYAKEGGKTTAGKPGWYLQNKHVENTKATQEQQIDQPPIRENEEHTAVRVPWDDYEIALMFDVYQEMSNGLPLHNAADKLSKLLREKAIRQVRNIDNVFRNTNGMVFYLKRTEYLFTGGKSGLDGAQKNVVKMFNLYNQNPSEYEKISLAAREMVGIKTKSTTEALTPEERQIAFRQWMQDNGMASGTSIVYSNALNQCTQFALQKGFSTTGFYQMTNAEMVRVCRDQLMADAEFAERNTRRSNQFRAAMTKYYLFVQKTGIGETKQPIAPKRSEKMAADPRWKEILENDFPDGYILNDFLCQFQAAGMWQEHFGEPCPLEGEAIDQVISAFGTVKDGHVFISNEDEGKLLNEIADLVADTLKTYSNIYTSQVYQRYREALAPLSIFTEKVMVQQVMQHAAGRFNYSYSYLFTKPGDTTITEVDCERALRKHGGMMTTEEAADTLWFIPRDKVSHYLSVNSEILNLGAGQWMLAEHFPFSREDAEQVAKMLDECFLSQEYILSRDIPVLLQQNLPFIAENVSNLSFAGLFNIIFYYLKDRYGFTRSIVTPVGVKVDFSMLYSAYAREHESFSMDDLDSYSKELHVPIYWESTFAGGAVRVSQDEFVNCSQIHFDIDAIDRAMESICSGDYMSFQSVPNGMLVLLPACGYQWNRYLLQSYVYGFSKLFRMSYSSFAKGGCYGAIVRRECKAIDSYEKLIEQVLTDDNTWTTQADALDLIVQQGYQAMRKFNGIENIMARAKQNKLNDGR